MDLFFLLKKEFPFNNIRKLEQMGIFRKIYDDEPFNLNKFQLLCSDLYGLACDFIIDVQLKKEQKERTKILSDALSERNYDLFKGVSKQLIKDIKEQQYFLGAEDYLLLFKLNYNLHQHLEKDKFSAHQKELGASWINLHQFYEDFRLQIEAENSGSSNFLQNRLTSLKGQKNQLSNLFSQVIELHKSKELSKYFQLKSQVFKDWDSLKKRYKTDLLIHLLNFSFTNVLIQKEFGHAEALSLYKVGIKDNLFIINGRMRDIEFINISMIGFKYESEKWAVNFIENHQQYLSEEVRAFIVPLAFAYNSIFQNDFERVIDLLRDVNPLNNLLYLGKIKRLLIRAFFEALIAGHEEYRSPLYYELESMKRMLKRNHKSSSTKMEANLNFLDLIKQLITLADNVKIDLNKIAAFEQQLNHTKPLVLKPWLTEKLLELKNAAS